MTQLNEKQVKMITKTIMPFLYLLQETQDQYEDKISIKDQSEIQELSEQASETTVENDMSPPC